ncbi:MAG TPA: hypothetical protein VH643_18115 [Gemmataceae bacterium]
MEETYVAIARAMRNADSLETLASIWDLRRDDIAALPQTWRHELEFEKRRNKAKLTGKTTDSTNLTALFDEERRHPIAIRLLSWAESMEQAAPQAPEAA